MTPTAIRYLDALDRRPAVPIDRVEAALKNTGVSDIPGPWLGFHDRFAGYVQPIARDMAVWGIVHDRPQFILPGAAALFSPGGGEETVVCADVHPSYSYELTRDGTFLGGPASSFEIFVEQLAAWWDFAGASYRPRLMWSVSDPAWTDFIHAKTRRLGYASDNYREVFTSERIHAVWDVEARRWHTILSR